MSFVIVTELNQVAYVKLHRPDVRNAFNPEMILELTQTFQSLAKRSDVRVVVLQGEGKVFCAGGDLNWMKDMVNYSFEKNVEDSTALFAMFESLAFCPQPVLGLVHGAAFGGALGLIAACDEVVAEDNTQFCFSEVKLGIAPAVISAFVNRKCVPGLVRPWMLSGSLFTPSQAAQMGLVHHVVRAGDGHSSIQKIIQNYLQAGPEAVRETKALMRYLETHSWSEQKTQTAQVIAQRRASIEGQEGLKSFLEKREPSWRVQS